MPKAKTFQDLSLAPYENDRELWRWLYQQLRLAIQDGRLKAGSRLPSTREIAEQYGLSRGTVATAFEQLQAEGYTRVEPGSGTFVDAELQNQFKAKQVSGRRKTAFPRKEATLSKLASGALQDVLIVPPTRSIGRAFRSWEPAIDLFPTELWARVASRVMRNAPRSLYGQGEALGYRPLRVAISEYLGSARGVACSPEQILVTSGAQQGLDLIARALLDPGDAVWVEDPGYPLALSVFRAVGAELVPVPVDEQGLDVQEGMRLSPKAKLAYVTPVNQFPLGSTMSAERRLALLHWAQQSGAWIIEDEYDAEYRYRGRPVAALQSLDQVGSVIYVGTFTKMLFNALRLGFVVLPEALVEPLTKMRTFMNRHSSTLDQAIVAEFISEGHYGQHVRRMRQIYSERLAVLREAAERQVGDLLEVEDAISGMRTIGRLLKHKSDEEVASRARNAGLNLFGVSTFTLKHRQPPALMLGFAGCDAHELRRGISVLAGILRKR